MALNPAYIGKRVLRGEIVGDGMWDGLVDETLYWAAVRLLKDPSQTTTRPGRAVHLLSYVVLCAVCGGPTSRQTVNRHGWSGELYSCLKKRCAAAPMDLMDEYVQRVAGRWSRRSWQLSALVGDLAVMVAGRAGAAVLQRFGVRISRCTVLRVLLGLSLPDHPVSAVLSVDDFALRRGRRMRRC